MKTITRGAGIIFLSLILSKILSFVYRLFIVHFYTVDDYGLFSEGLAIITLLKTFAVLGLVTAMVRYTSFYNARKDHVGLRAVLLTSLKYTIPLSVILACVLYVSADYLEVVVFAETGLADFLRVFALSLPFFSVSLLFAYFFMGLKLIKYNIYIQEIIPNLLKFVLVASFWFFGLGTIGIPLSWTVSFFLVILFSLVLLKRAFPSLHNIDGKRSLDKTLLIFSLPVFFGDIVITLMHWTGTLALGISETAEVVGIYNAALPTAELLLLVPVSFSALFMSVITEYYSLKKFGEVEKINRIVNKWIFLIGLALFLPLAIFSQQILGALFGFDYIIGSVAMSILAIGFIVNSLEYTS
ncbi:MAG: oligosaccharide flippase family protein, partial [Candidatus Aenigmatarchaeota archaeon]